jgi:hypothetical protein
MDMKKYRLLLLVFILIAVQVYGQSRRVIGIIPFGNKNGNARYAWLTRGIEEILYDKLKSE